MLVELSIRHLALIESLDLSLGTGLNAISGETGAGKSLFVGALELLRGEPLRGGRAGAKQWIRSKTSEAHVDGRFELQGARAIEGCLAILEHEVPAVAEIWRESLQGDRAELLLGRRLSAEGRSSAHIEQRPVPLRALRALAPQLLEIHGQNDHQRLLEPGEQGRLLDHYGGLAKQVARHAEARRAQRALVREREGLEQRRAERRDRQDMLRFQVEELGALELTEGEGAELREERELLRGASELRSELGGHAFELVEADGSLLDRLRATLQSVERWSARIPSLAAVAEDLANAEIHVSESAASLSSLVESVSDDPARLEWVEERLHQIERLGSKYGCDEAGLIALAGERAVQLQELETAEESLADLDARLVEAEKELRRAAVALRKKRSALVPGLRRDVQAALASLGLEKARFDVAVGDPLGAAPASPEDEGSQPEVVFLLAANPGEDPGALQRVASGGETARIMLALQSVLHSAHGGDGRTLVFDEIDSGVGGRLGPEVAGQLRRLAQSAQVLCVTHIPAIAAAADLHLGTVKEVRKGRTRTDIRPLDGDERVREVADMIAGGSDHETARAEARRLLTESNA